MKLRIFAPWFLLTLFASLQAASQCVSPLVAQRHADTVSYTGNYFNTFSFPRADPAIGTLVEVKVTTTVTITADYTIENISPTMARNHNVRLAYDAYVSGPAITGSIDSSKTYNLGTHFLQPNDGVPGSGPDFYVAPTRHLTTDTIINRRIDDNVAPFLGVGNVDFNFESNEFAISSPAGGNISANTQIVFAVEYFYCNTWFLASDLSYFTAVKNGGKNVKLNWGAENEGSVKHYEIEVSEDGLNFTKVAVVNASRSASSHSFDYAYSSFKEHLYFRIRQVELGGKSRLSPTRSLNWKKEDTQKLQLYPNPSSGQFTIDFPKSGKSNWKVDIIGANGQTIQTNKYLNAEFARIYLGSGIAKGFYVVRVTNEHSQEQFIHRLVISGK